jgi:hypothetical protein
VIGDSVPAKLALKSKSERGYELTAGKPAGAIPAQKIKLLRGTSTAVAFRIIGRSILGHIAANVKKRLPDFKNRLRVLQDRLGALNDIAVHQKLATKVSKFAGSCSVAQTADHTIQRIHDGLRLGRRRP